MANSNGIPKALVPTDRRMAIPDLIYLNGPCHRPLIRMIIRYDGSMANSCEDTYGAFNLGNVHQSAMEELWFSEVHTQLIQDLITGHREKYALCLQCPLSPTGPTPDGRRINISLRQYVGVPEAVTQGSFEE